MPRTLEEVDADIARFQAAEDDLLLGKSMQSLKHNGREVGFDAGGDRSALVRRRLLELKHERAKLTGERSPFAPITPPIMD